MKMNKHLNVKHLLWLCSTFLVLQFSITSCKEVIANETFYTFTGEMVTDYLQNRSEKFSDFIEVLQRAEIYDLLSTYGTYTCFAPTNTAMNSYLQSRGLTSVSQMTKSECDTLAYSHLIKVTYFTTDMNDGVISTTNMNDRYLSLTCDTTKDDQKTVRYHINQDALIINRDDSVENGVVHTIDHVLTSSNDLLPTVLEKNPTITLFCQAMKLTGLDVLTSKYIDPTYSCSHDSVELGIYYHTGNEWETGYFMKQRKFRYTAFVETNQVFADAGIDTTSLQGLKAYAKSVYDATYPKDAGLYDQDWTNRKNPLNRFIAYHFLDRLGTYYGLTISGEVKRLMQVTTVMDATDTYETLCPHTVMQVSYPSDGLYLNRKGVGAHFSVKGVKIAPSDSLALNGVYHYIDNILTYSTETKDIVFNCRFRFDATTLSPDFMNGTPAARGRAGTATCTAFKDGAVKDWSFSDKTFVSVRNRHTEFDSYQGDEVVLLGQYDFTFKLPPVPEGTYEIRLGYCAMWTRGVIQTIFKRRSNDGSWIKPFISCGIPLDLRVFANNPAIGWVADTGNKETDMANDKAMHNRGYMKGPDSIEKNGSPSFRNSSATFRCILTTRYLSADEDNYLHIRQVLDNPKAEFAFDYIELCPKSVYDNGEDTH